jgi:hypothetical protein
MRFFAVFGGMSIQLESPAPGFWPLLWSRAHQAARGGGKKLRLLAVIREEKSHFCSTNHFPRNKISLPALYDFNAGKLFF